MVAMQTAFRTQLVPRCNLKRDGRSTLSIRSTVFLAPVVHYLCPGYQIVLGMRPGLWSNSPCVPGWVTNVTEGSRAGKGAVGVA